MIYANARRLSYGTYERNHAKCMAPWFWDDCQLAYFPLGATKDWRDLSGNDNHGTLTNGPTWEPTPFGTGLGFDSASSQYGAVPNATTFLPSTAMTVGILVRLSTNNTQQLVIKWGTGVATDSNQFHFWINNGRYYLHLRDGTDTDIAGDSGYSVAANTWDAVACVADGTYLRYYVNGRQLAASQAYNSGINVPASPNDTSLGVKLVAGVPRDPLYFDGALAAVCLWDVGLTPTQAIRWTSNPLAPVTRRPTQISFYTGGAPATGIVRPKINGGLVGTALINRGLVA